MSRLVTGLYSQSDEILAEIFREHVERTTEDITCTSDGPWVLSRVCRLWRKITLAHPELWAIVRVEGDRDDMDAFDGFGSDSENGSDSGGIDTDDVPRRPTALFLLDLALQRSQDYPLEVTLDFRKGGNHRRAAVMRGMGLRQNTKTLQEELISAVVAHSNRWRTAELRITNVLVPFFAPIRNRLSLLTELSIMMFTETVIRPFPYAQIAPRLAYITLVNYPHQHVSLPWSSIRSFSESSQFPVTWRSPSTNSTQRYLKLFRNLNPRLESLNVTYPFPSPSSQPPPPPLSLLHLRRLLTAEEGLIRSLTLPKLEELIVAPKADTMPAIHDLLTRSKCSLRSLCLINFTLDEDVTAILSSSTGLQTLMLRFSGWEAGDEKTMNLLVQELAEPSFLPCLEHLDITIDQDDYAFFDSEPVESPYKIGFIDDTFVEMLAARWERCRLKKVSVRVELPTTLALSKTRGVGRLRKMCDEGLDVFLKARDPRALDLTQKAKDISYVYDT
ncbi:hypothetical protein B0H11DRAFT_1978296 [Mycena galericulata]|nr:hypothetical protein B0H11DRAFT_1978296 [Mycena galericulata]